MNMFVCVRQVINPETPAPCFGIDFEQKKVVVSGDRSVVINPFCENAVEAALRVKDAHGGRVTILSMGDDSAGKVIKHCLAMGGDEGVLLSDPSYEDSDSYATAVILAGAIKRMGEYDIIFCGRQDGDWDAGQVGSGIAEILGIPSVTPVKKIEIREGKAVVERIVSDGYDVIEVPTPVLFSVSNEIGEARYATIKGMMKVSKKPITTWDAGNVPAAHVRSRIVKMFIPVRKGRCACIEGKNSEEAGANLAVKLRENRLI